MFRIRVVAAESKSDTESVLITAKYESKHAREIRHRKDETNKQFDEKRAKLESEKTTELESFKEERAKQDEEIENWKKEFEKSSKKVAKKADKLAASG